jgi:hypothetical protein
VLVFHQRGPALRWSAAVATVCLLAIVNVGCGSGGTSDAGGSVGVGSGVLLKNNVLTYGGTANPHAITAFSFIHGAASGDIPLALLPGDSAFIPLEPGRYNFAVRFDDGAPERLQVPSDQVVVAVGEVTTILFLHT